MSSTASPERRSAALDRLYVDACQVELRALKPGNVHTFTAGHGMTVADFETSAHVSAAPLCAPGASVGRRIHGAIAATRAAVGCNTNLGIVLLAAPLLAAAERRDEAGLRPALAAVLAALTLADAEAAYAAIRLAQPAGLGRAADQDVAAPPTVDLRRAMALAADRDRIARQYATDYADVFEIGVARLAAAEHDGATPEAAATDAYLHFLAAFPDSHVERKFGAPAAAQVRGEAADLLATLERMDETERWAALHDFDRRLKARSINPGTSADLTVASLLARSCGSILFCV